MRKESIFRNRRAHPGTFGRDVSEETFRVVDHRPEFDGRGRPSLHLSCIDVEAEEDVYFYRVVAAQGWDKFPG
jgi:hypothetical protein